MKYYQDRRPNVDFKQYQEQAHKTAVYPNEFAKVYPLLGLAGEVGEFCNKVKKELRGDVITDYKTSLEAELGDILWYLAEIATVNNINMNDVAKFNLKKLRLREASGKLKGSGDNR